MDTLTYDHDEFVPDMLIEMYGNLVENRRYMLDNVAEHIEGLGDADNREHAVQFIQAIDLIERQMREINDFLGEAFEGVLEDANLNV